MNYIKHLNKAFEIMFEDDRLSSNHLMLYLTLFHHWNRNRFKEYFYINRSDIMNESRIKSLTTYTRCMRELESWGYLGYYPSFNSITGTKICIYPLHEKEEGGMPRTETPASVQPTVAPVVQLGVPPAVQPPVVQEVQVLYTNNTKEYKQSERQNIPAHQDVLDFFRKNTWDATEASKFFFHYEMNGWVAGNNNPIRDWEAAAQKWMLNTSTYNNSYGTETRSHQQPAAANLHASTNKNYSEPL